MRRKIYQRNTEAIYTLNSILLNPLIRYTAPQSGMFYARRGGGIYSPSPFGNVPRTFWIVLKGNSLLFEGSKMSNFTAMLGKDKLNENNFNFYIDCDEEELTVKLI